MKLIGKILLIGMALMVLAGCGKDNSSVSIFITDDFLDPSEIREPLTQKLQEKLGEEFNIKVSTSPIYNEQKILIEYAAREHEIFILPEDVMKLYAMDGTHVVLDQNFDAEKYPTGVFEAGVLDSNTDDVAMETHLFAIPISEMKVFQDLNYTREVMYATIPVSTDSMEDSIKLLKAMIE
ncbi:hypothetical protein [Paenibacillus crassostreae]|uniref:Uncharacterized protein n=1 Tax=Paenibacillus crassostreae TaxID=1763538 RepID=A0A167GTH3_9BACL|nr:hypothetical protein [Paenibacillus crassostreae]AOZ92080.1 hypothetical protein LPB68_07490 [Paenibacillus crassostreae]OAB77889.1 hypothetical protein PNBC_00570 [Paenibacillus crassostreae]